MSVRKFQNETGNALSEKVTAFWNDQQALEEIAHELSHRSTRLAATLRSKVDLRLGELRAPKGDAQRGAESDTLRAMYRATQAALKESERKRGELEQELKLFKQRGSYGTPNATLYSAIGVTEDIPDFALKALRTAYRKKYHPDHYPDDQKRSVEKQFQDFETKFAKIESLRGRKL